MSSAASASPVGKWAKNANLNARLIGLLQFVMNRPYRYLYLQCFIGEKGGQKESHRLMNIFLLMAQNTPHSIKSYHAGAGIFPYSIIDEAEKNGYEHGAEMRKQMRTFIIELYVIVEETYKRAMKAKTKSSMCYIFCGILTNPVGPRHAICLRLEVDVPTSSLNLAVFDPHGEWLEGDKPRLNILKPGDGVVDTLVDAAGLAGLTLYAEPFYAKHQIDKGIQVVMGNPGFCLIFTLFTFYMLMTTGDDKILHKMSRGSAPGGVRTAIASAIFLPYKAMTRFDSTAAAVGKNMIQVVPTFDELTWLKLKNMRVERVAHPTGTQQKPGAMLLLNLYAGIHSAYKEDARLWPDFPCVSASGKTRVSIFVAIMLFTVDLIRGCAAVRVQSNIRKLVQKRKFNRLKKTAAAAIRAKAGTSSPKALKKRA